MKKLKLTSDEIDFFNERFKLIEDEGNIVAFPEIHVSDQQLKIMADPMFSLTKNELKEYYKGKINGEILFTQSCNTTKEDQPDFQYLFDLGIKALASGMTL